MSDHFGQPMRQGRNREANARLEALLTEGLDSGEDVEVNREFWKRLRAEAARLLEERPRHAGTSGPQP